MKRIFISMVLMTLLILGTYKLYPREYKELVAQYAHQYEVDPLLIYAIMKVESKYNPYAVSRSGAKGLMQIMDKTGAWGAQEVNIREYTHDILFKPEANIQIGCWYVAKLIKQYEGNLNVALAAYNAGPGNVYKWRNDPKYSFDGKTLYNIPFKETSSYVKKVQWHYKVYQFLYKH
jgi:soluble lytic murein transglycosylase